MHLKLWHTPANLPKISEELIINASFCIILILIMIMIIVMTCGISETLALIMTAVTLLMTGIHYFNTHLNNLITESSFLMVRSVPLRRMFSV